MSYRTEEMRMTFGKHCGEYVSDLPAGYLKWLLTCDNLSYALREHVRECLYGPPEPDYETASTAAVQWQPILSQWQREMSLRFHPDRGGSVEAMSAINSGVDRLRELFKAQSEN